MHDWSAGLRWLCTKDTLLLLLSPSIQGTAGRDDCHSLCVPWCIELAWNEDFCILCVTLERVPMGVMDQNTGHTHSLPSMPFSRRYHMVARRHRAAPVCGGGEHNGSCLDTSQMLTWACSLSPPWLAEDKGEKDNEKNFIELVGSFYSLDFNKCLMHMFSQVFFFSCLFVQLDLEILFHSNFCLFWFTKPGLAITFHSTSEI